MDAKQVVKIYARNAGESDDTSNQEVQTYDQLVNDLSCEEWKNELVILIIDDETVRWGISSLFASSSTRNLYNAHQEQDNNKKKNQPIGFEGVPLQQKKSSITVLIHKK